jgi:hypothetical protein
MNELDKWKRDIERTVKAIDLRVSGHSKFLATDVAPELDLLRKQIERLWVSNKRFTDLEQAVADIAAVVYKNRTGRAP